MRQTVLPLLMALAVSLVALGGVAAAGTATQTHPAHPTPNDAPDDGSVPPTHPSPHETPQDGGPGVGVCVVGADSPCNDAGGSVSETPSTDESTTDGATTDGGSIVSDNDRSRCHVEPAVDDESDDGMQKGIPDVVEKCESENGSDSGRIFLPEDQNRDGQLDDRFTSASPDAHDGENIGSGDDGSDGRMWIPEDQNHDGEIDDRFVGSVGTASALGQLMVTTVLAF